MNAALPVIQAIPTAQQDPGHIPDPSEDNEYCKRIWEEALSICERRIDEDDFEEVRKFSTVEELVSRLQKLQEDYKQGTVASLLAKIGPALDHFRTFTIAVAFTTRAHFVETALLWGVVSLLVQLTLKSQETLREIVNMLTDLGDNFEIFHIYQTMFTEDSNMSRALVDIFADVVQFGVYTIQFLRRHPVENMAKQAWGNVQNEFKAVIEKLSKRMHQWERKAQALRLKTMVDQQEMGAANLASMLNDLGIDRLSKIRDQSSGDEAKLPCHILNFRHIPRFIGREDTLKEIKSTLHPDEETSDLRSLALWGTAGVGKSQTAFRYAQGRISDGLQAVFWVNSETDLQVAEAFTQIALTLGLKEADASGSPSAHDKNRYLVLSWLSKTVTNWLLIFDNVESSESLQDYWPSSSTGTILVTCRSISVAAELTENDLEIKALSPPEGRKMIMKLVGRQSYSDRESESGEELSQDLGGLPLAIDIMATQMRKRRMQIQKFLPYYRSNYRTLHKGPLSGKLSLYYENSLSKAWDLAFTNISSDASTLLGVISLLAADSIPESLFRSEKVEKYPIVHFMRNENLLENAVQDLVDNALIVKDFEISSVSVHRLIQTEFRDRLPPHDQVELFEIAVHLLSDAVPKREKGLPLRRFWAQYKDLIPHITTLSSRSEVLEKAQPCMKKSEEFANLLASAAWYLLESNAYDQCLEIIRIAFQACTDKSSRLHATLCNTAGQIFAERAQTDQAFDYFNQSLEIQEKSNQPDYGELSDLYNNFALLLLSTDELGKARAYMEKAMDIDKHKSLKEQEQTSHLRHLNISSVLEAEGRFDTALEEAVLGRECAVKIFGPECHFEGQGFRQEGNCLYYQKNFDAASERLKRALKIFEKENVTQPIVATTCYTMGRVALAQGDNYLAVESLEKALLVCRLNERKKGDQGDTARIMRKFSDALRLTGATKEADDLKEAANKIRLQLRKSFTDDDKGWNSLVHVIFR